MLISYQHFLKETKDFVERYAVSKNEFMQPTVFLARSHWLTNAGLSHLFSRAVFESKSKYFSDKFDLAHFQDYYYIHHYTFLIGKFF